MTEVGGDADFQSIAGDLEADRIDSIVRQRETFDMKTAKPEIFSRLKGVDFFGQSSSARQIIGGFGSGIQRNVQFIAKYPGPLAVVAVLMGKQCAAQFIRRKSRLSHPLQQLLAGKALVHDQCLISPLDYK